MQMFDYTKKRNFDHFIGALVRRDDMVILGQVCNIDYFVDRHGHNVAMAEVAHFNDDDIERINCDQFMILR